MNVLEEFNKTLDEFINKLIVQFPEETKLKTYYSAFKVTKMYDKSVPIKIFMGGCLEFKDQIKNRDSQFFIHRPQFINKVAKCSSFSDDIGLVNYWQNLSETSQKAIWDYVQTLFVMGEMYINKDTSIIQKINNVYNNMKFDDTLNNLENNKTITKEYLEKITHNS